MSLLITPEEGEESRDYHYLLQTAVKILGDEAAYAACGVFESIMSSRQELEFLRADMEFCLRLADYFAKITSRMCGVPAVAQKFASKKALKRTVAEDIQFQPKRPLSKVWIGRISGLYIMIRSVLETSSLAREAFLLSCESESMVNVVFCLGRSTLQEDEDGDMISSLLGLFETLRSIVDARIGFNSREMPDDAELTQI